MKKQSTEHLTEPITPKNLHKWDVTPKEAIGIQLELRKRVSDKFSAKNIRLVAGADVSIPAGGDCVKAAVCILTFPDMRLVEEATAELKLSFPYIPGLLSFREGPVLLECFKKIRVKPDVIIFDGQGTAHPRGFGIAAHMGVLLDIPSIGCGKSPLFGKYEMPHGAKSSRTDIRDKGGNIIGSCLRTRTNVKPLFVSIGHRISLLAAMDIVLRCALKYRLPEPVRRAHNLAGLRGPPCVV